MRNLVLGCVLLLTGVLTSQNQAAANQIGFGCLGSNGRPTLSASQAPILGTSLDLVLTNLPNNTPSAPGYLWYLWSTEDTNWAGFFLPLDMDRYGMPGCMLYLSPFYRTFDVQPAPMVSTPYNVPNQASLLGCRLLCQVMVCDFGVNQVGYTSTNMLEMLFGQ